MRKMVWDQDLADAAQDWAFSQLQYNYRTQIRCRWMFEIKLLEEYVESCKCLSLCEHGFPFNTSQRYGYKSWFPLAREDGQRFGQNLFFSFVDNSTLATFAVSEWHGEISQYHYVSMPIVMWGHLSRLWEYSWNWKYLSREGETSMTKSFTVEAQIHTVKKAGNVVITRRWCGQVSVLFIDLGIETNKWNIFKKL